MYNLGHGLLNNSRLAVITLATLCLALSYHYFKENVFCCPDNCISRMPRLAVGWSGKVKVQSLAMQQETCADCVSAKHLLLWGFMKAESWVFQPSHPPGNPTFQTAALRSV